MAHVRGFGSFLVGLLALVLLGAIGVGIYDAGLQQGIAQSASVPAGTVPYYAYGYGFHGGFGLFGLLFPLLFLFLIFGLVRAAFRGGRGGWGHGYGRWGGGPWMSGPDRDAWTAERDSRIADLHRRLHEEPGSSGSTTGTSQGPGSTGQPS
jgi:hypothetical protein